MTRSGGRSRVFGEVLGMPKKRVRKKRRKASSGSRKARRKRGRAVKYKRHPWRRPHIINVTKDVRRDKMYHALPPGKRVSASGKVYYEYRSNRSDVNPRKGL